jgi:archaellum component FlaC
MSLRKDKIQLEVEINGQKAGKTYNELIRDARNLNRELRNLTPGTDAFVKKSQELRKVNDKLAGIRQETRGVAKGMGGMQAAAAKALPIIGALFATERIIEYGKQLLRIGTQQDQLANKSLTVLGPALDEVTKAAEENAQAMGLTNNQYISAATNIADLLVPMGFQRQEAAGISSELVNLSGALSEWTGGQIKSEEVTRILSKALLGEREELKQLGISITEADVKARLAEKGLDKLTGQMLEQAKATATLELITEKSADAQTSFANNTDSLVRKQAELSAKVQEISERLATKLIPVFSRLIDVADDVIDFFGDVGEGINRLVDPAGALSDEFNKQTETVKDLENNFAPLIDRYEELTGKTELNKDEQKELDDIIAQIAETVPYAVTEMDKYGNALGINAGKAREFLQSEKARLAFVNQEAIQATRDEIERLKERRDAAEELIDALQQIEPSQRIKFDNAQGELKKLRKELKDTTLLIEGAGQELARLEGRFSTEADPFSNNLGEQFPDLFQEEAGKKGGGDTPGPSVDPESLQDRLGALKEQFELENALLLEEYAAREVTQEQFREVERMNLRDHLEAQMRLYEQYGETETAAYVQLRGQLRLLEEQDNIQTVELLSTTKTQELEVISQAAQERIKLKADELNQLAEQELRHAQFKKGLDQESINSIYQTVLATKDALKQDEQAKAKHAKLIKSIEVAKATVDVYSEISSIWKNAQQSPIALALGPAAGTALAAVQTALALYRHKTRVQAILTQEFAGGGRVEPLPHISGRRVRERSNIPRRPNGDSVLATLKPNEVVLNEDQQAMLGGAATFARIGVPGFNTGGLVTVNTTPVAQQQAATASPGQSEIPDQLVQEMRALREDFARMNTRLRAYVVYTDIEDAAEEKSVLQSESSI